MAFRRSSVRSFGRFRRRARFAPRFTRRAAKSSIFRRSGHAGNVVNKDFMVPSILGQSITGINATGSLYSGSNTYVSVPGNCVSAATGFAAGNAMTYVFQFSLGHLASANNAYKNVYLQAYDAFKIRAITVKLKSCVSPKQAVTTPELAAATAAYQFQFMPNYQPTVTWIDEDGSLQLSTLNITSPPANGDLTDYVQGRLGRKTHKAFGSIVRRFVPFVSVALNAALTAPGPDPSNSGGAAPIQPPPFQVSGNSTVPHCALGLAVGYCGFNGTSTFQPVFSWVPEVIYHMALRSPLF